MPVRVASTMLSDRSAEAMRANTDHDAARVCDSQIALPVVPVEYENNQIELSAHVSGMGARYFEQLDVRSPYVYWNGA